MLFNPAIEGKVGANWILACSPYGVEQVVDYTTLGILAGTRTDFPPVPLRGKPADMSAGLTAMQGSLGARRFSYFTLAELRAYAGLVLSERAVSREIAPGEVVKEHAPLYALLVAQLAAVANRFNLPRDQVRLVYGFDWYTPTRR